MTMRPIDADDAMRKYRDLMDQLIKSTNDPNISREALSLLAGTSVIGNAPTIDAAPVVHAKWISYAEEFNDPEITTYECSVCHNISCCKGNYCPDCGAKMDGDGNDE